jgi:hypothetical protein
VAADAQDRKMPLPGLCPVSVRYRAGAQRTSEVIAQGAQIAAQRAKRGLRVNAIDREPGAQCNSGLAVECNAPVFIDRFKRGFDADA